MTDVWVMTFSLNIKGGLARQDRSWGSGGGMIIWVLVFGESKLGADGGRIVYLVPLGMGAKGAP